MEGSALRPVPSASVTLFSSGTSYIKSNVAPANVGEVYRIMFEARFQNGCPTPPADTTASHSGVPAAGALKPPGGMMFVVQGLVPSCAVVGVAPPIPEAGFGAVPVDSRRPMIDVTGPNTDT
jgi:hypothetical protein